VIRNIYQLLIEIKGHRVVLWRLVAQQLILRYRRTALGYLWTLINPLINMTVMALVFSTIYKADLNTFAIFLFAGMIPWNFFNAVVTQSGTSFINNESLIKKIYLPKMVFPLSIAISLLIDNALSFLALFVIILAIGGSLSWAVLFIPVAYLLLFFFALGAGLVMSIATVFFRDLQHVILIVMQALFFLTPILYKPSSLSGKVAWLVDLNPVASYIELFRAPLFQSSLPSTGTILMTVGFSLAAMIIGLYVFLRLEKQVVFRL